VYELPTAGEPVPPGPGLPAAYDPDGFPDGVDDVQADVHHDPHAELLDLDDAPLNEAPPGFADAAPGETREEDG